MAKFARKTIYHSDLVKETAAEGGLNVTVQTGLQDGRAGGKIMGLKVDGDDTDYWLMLENPGCEEYAARNLQKDVRYVLSGTGSREGAAISCVPAAGGAAYAPPPTAEEKFYADPQQVHAVSPPADTRSSEALLLECLIAAGRVVGEFREEYDRDPTQVDQDLAVTLFIQMHRR